MAVAIRTAHLSSESQIIFRYYITTQLLLQLLTHTVHRYRGIHWIRTCSHASHNLRLGTLIVCVSAHSTHPSDIIVLFPANPVGWDGVRVWTTRVSFLMLPLSRLIRKSSKLTMLVVVHTMEFRYYYSSTSDPHIIEAVYRRSCSFSCEYVIDIRKKFISF